VSIGIGYLLWPIAPPCKQGGVKLLDDFVSCSNEVEIYNFLHHKNIAWHEVERSSLDPEDKRPPFNVLRIMLPDYSHQGIDGELIVLFYNDRLTSVTFYPFDANKYISRIREKELINRKGVNVQTGQDFRGKTFFEWYDQTLKNSMNLWLMKYS
jgi:hypothetical protein